MISLHFRLQPQYKIWIISYKLHINEQTRKFETSFSKILVIFAWIRHFVFEALHGILDLNLLKIAAEQA